jgi:hypothetical protein
LSYRRHLSCSAAQRSSSRKSRGGTTGGWGATTAAKSVAPEHVLEFVQQLRTRDQLELLFRPGAHEPCRRTAWLEPCIGRHLPPTKVEARLAVLHERLRPFEPRTAFSQKFNRDVRRATGYDRTEEEDN